MKMKLLGLILLAFLSHDTLCAQSLVDIRKGKLRELSYLTGNWTVTTIEKNTAGDSILQTGTWTYRFDMDSTVIRNDRSFTVTHATGSLKSIPKFSKFYEYFLYNTSRNLFEFIDAEGGRMSPARLILVDTKKRIIQYGFYYFDTEKQLTINVTNTLKAISDTELVETGEARAFETGELVSLYTATVKKTR